MLKNDGWIKKFGADGGIVPFNPENVNPASYDITLGCEVIVYEDRREAKYYDLSQVSVELRPWARALVVTNEHLTTPDHVAMTVRLKSSLARQGIVAPMGLFVDPGYRGTLTFMLVNMGDSPYALSLGRRVGQLIFFGMSDPAEIPYGDERRKSHYQGSTGLTPNKSTL